MEAFGPQPLGRYRPSRRSSRSRPGASGRAVRFRCSTPPAFITHVDRSPASPAEMPLQEVPEVQIVKRFKQVAEDVLESKSSHFRPDVHCTFIMPLAVVL